MPFGHSNVHAELLRFHFRDGEQHVELNEKVHTRYNEQLQALASCRFHCSAMTWKAVAKFELDRPLEELLVDDHTVYMMWLC